MKRDLNKRTIKPKELHLLSDSKLMSGFLQFHFTTALSSTEFTKADLFLFRVASRRAIHAIHSLLKCTRQSDAVVNEPT
jgi:hypothetical protein